MKRFILALILALPLLTFAQATYKVVSRSPVYQVSGNPNLIAGFQTQGGLYATPLVKDTVTGNWWEFDKDAPLGFRWKRFSPGTIQGVIDNQRGDDDFMDINYYNNIHTVANDYYAVANPGVINFNAAEFLRLTSGDSLWLESNIQLDINSPKVAINGVVHPQDTPAGGGLPPGTYIHAVNEAGELAGSNGYLPISDLGVNLDSLSIGVVQDSIVVLYNAGVEISRDTVRTGGGTVSTDGTTITGDGSGGSPLAVGVIGAGNIATGAVGATQLASTAVTAGSYTYMSGTVDADGRFTAASSGVAPVTGSGVAQQVAFFSGAQTVAGDAGLTFASNRLTVAGIPITSYATNQASVGPNAGNGATSASNSNFFGSNAGNGATSANNSNFFGAFSGNGATSANNSNFFGALSGNNATNATNSNFFGSNAGNGATSASYSNFFGTLAGNGATNATYANFFGNNAGRSATGASYANFFGNAAGNNATGAIFSNFFGSNAGNGATSASNSNFFGAFSGNGATSASYANFFGNAAGNNATGAIFSNFFGSNAGNGATSASNSNFFGNGAGNAATIASNSNFFGAFSGNGATSANNSNFFGALSGNNATNATNSNFFGSNAGSGATSASYSTLMGYSAGRATATDTIGPNNVIIGTSVSLPDGRQNSMNIGGVLFGSGFYFSTSTTPSIAAQASGRIGIGVVLPEYALDITATGGIRIGRGTTAQRGVGVAGYFGYNTTWGGYEGHNGTAFRYFLDLPAATPTSGHIPVFTGGAWTTAGNATATGTLDFPSTSAHSSSDLTITVTGAAVGETVSIGAHTAPPANGLYFAWVSATNAVTVRFINAGAGASDPASASFTIRVHKI